VTDTGVLRPAGGVKGFGLAMIVEALAGALTGAGTVSAHPEHDDQGTLVIALDIASLRPMSDFVAEVEEAITYVREIPPGGWEPASADAWRRRGADVSATYRRWHTRPEFHLAAP